MKQDKVYIYGRHALYEALLGAPHVIDRVFLSPEVNDPDLRKMIKKAGLTVSTLGKEGKVRNVKDDDVHQGVVARISLDKLLVSYDTFVNNVEVDKNTCLVLLGEVGDPHNVGAIIRSAAAFGATGVLIPEHKQAPVTGTVVKVSAGMAFRLPLVLIGNVNTTIRDLKERGYWIYGLAGEGDKRISEEEYTKPTVFVLGNEGYGVREKTKEACDMLLSIPIDDECESLNVAAAAAVTLYEWSSQKKGSS